MKKRKGKSTNPKVSLSNLILGGLVDLIIGVLLILIEKSIK